MIEWLYRIERWLENHQTWFVLAGVALIAFGTIWTAYESHIANIGVMMWQSQMGEVMRHGQ